MALATSTSSHPSSEPSNNVYVGPSGWSYPDWKGIVYPPGATSRFDPLSYIATYFDAVEVNTSFYHPISHKTSESWIKRVADRDRFRFALKLHRAFTHERGDYGASDVAAFIDGVRPIVEASRLACLLMQFPWSFRNTKASRDWIRKLAEDFSTLPLVVEVRHISWNDEETITYLKDLHVGWCAIDQPALGDCLPPAPHVTSPIAYVRFHGRRRDTWFADDVPTYERYNYLYQDDELKGWSPRLHSLREHADTVYVFANNHYRGQGPANALQLRAMIDGGHVDVPEGLIEHFPFLKSIRTPPASPQQPSLF